jgi:hypothetical protein
MGEIDLAISDYSVALELDLKTSNEVAETNKEEKEQSSEEKIEKKESRPPQNTS